jgi:hypothetical protein
VQQGTEQHEQIRQDAKEVGRMLSDEEKPADGEEGQEDEPTTGLEAAFCPRALCMFRVFHCFLLSFNGAYTIQLA